MELISETNKSRTTLLTLPIAVKFGIDERLTLGVAQSKIETSINGIRTVVAFFVNG
jgi:hypothetical protein